MLMVTKLEVGFRNRGLITIGEALGMLIPRLRNGTADRTDTDRRDLTSRPSGCSGYRLSACPRRSNERRELRVPQARLRG
jgi:hypothetical protein